MNYTDPFGLCASDTSPEYKFGPKPGEWDPVTQADKGGIIPSGDEFTIIAAASFIKTSVQITLGVIRESIAAVPKVISAVERAVQIHEVVPSATQSRTTIAVTETAQGTRVVSSSEARLRPAQRNLLNANEVEGIGPGHAEVTGVNAAQNLGLTPTGTAASRPICNNCANFLQQSDVTPLSPLKR